MRVFDLIKLAVLNIVSNLKMAVSILVGFVIIMEVIMISVGYGYSMNDYITNIIDNNSSLVYCSNLFGDFSESDIETFRNDNRIEGVQVLQKYNIYQYCEDNNKMIDAAPLAYNEISFDAAIMKMDGITYQGKNDFSYDFEIEDESTVSRTDKIVKFQIGVLEGEDNLQISESECHEFQNKYGSKEPFLAGGRFTKKNQIIVTYYILEKLGCQYTAKECIGKEISLYIATQDGEFCIVENYEICGVLDSNFYRISSRMQMPQILLSNANPDYCVMNSQKIFGHSFRKIICIVS